MAENFRPGDYGEEYHKVWKCDGYNIRIDSDARKFPDSTHPEKISIDGNSYELEFINDGFAVGISSNYTEDGETYGKFDSVFTDDKYDKGFFDFTMHIDKFTDSKYNYLKGKTLVFHKK